MTAQKIAITKILGTITLAVLYVFTYIIFEFIYFDLED